MLKTKSSKNNTNLLASEQGVIQPWHLDMVEFTFNIPKEFYINYIAENLQGALWAITTLVLIPCILFTYALLRLYSARKNNIFIAYTNNFVKGSTLHQLTLFDLDATGVLPLVLKSCSFLTFFSPNLGLRMKQIKQAYASVEKTKEEILTFGMVDYYTKAPPETQEKLLSEQLNSTLFFYFNIKLLLSFGHKGEQLLASFENDKQFLYDRYEGYFCEYTTLSYANNIKR